jgi:hypothetical protein
MKKEDKRAHGRVRVLPIICHLSVIRNTVRTGQSGYNPAGAGHHKMRRFRNIRSNGMNTLPYTFTPLSMGQLLDRAFRLYRRHFLTFVGIIAVVQIVPALFNLGIVLGPDFAILASFGGLISSVLGIFGAAAMATAVAQSYFGQEISVMGAYRTISDRIGALIGLLFLLFAIGVVLFIWMLVPIVGWFTGPGAIFFFSFGATAVLVPCVMLEDIPLENGLRRMWDLTRQRFWWIVGLGLIMGLLSSIVVIGPILIVALASQFTFGFNSVWPTLIQTFMTTVIGILFTPFSLTVYTLLYFDLRIRFEGFDLSVAAAHAGETAASVPDLLQNAPPPEKGNRLTTDEIMSFVGLSLLVYGLLGIYFLFAFSLLSALVGPAGLGPF